MRGIFLSNCCPHEARNRPFASCFFFRCRQAGNHAAQTTTLSENVALEQHPLPCRAVPPHLFPAESRLAGTSFPGGSKSATCVTSESRSGSRFNASNARRVLAAPLGQGASSRLKSAQAASLQAPFAALQLYNSPLPLPNLPPFSPESIPGSRHRQSIDFDGNTSRPHRM